MHLSAVVAVIIASLADGISARLVHGLALGRRCISRWHAVLVGRRAALGAAADSRAILLAGGGILEALFGTRGAGHVLADAVVVGQGAGRVRSIWYLAWRQRLRVLAWWVVARALAVWRLW